MYFIWLKPQISPTLQYVSHHNIQQEDRTWGVMNEMCMQQINNMNLGSEVSQMKCRILYNMHIYIHIYLCRNETSNSKYTTVCIHKNPTRGREARCYKWNVYVTNELQEAGKWGVMKCSIEYLTIYNVYVTNELQEAGKWGVMKYSIEYLTIYICTYVYFVYECNIKQQIRYSMYLTHK